MIVPMLAVAGSLVRKKIVPVSAGTFPTDSPLFVGLVVRRDRDHRRTDLLPGGFTRPGRRALLDAWPALSSTQAANHGNPQQNARSPSPRCWIRRSFCRRSGSRSSSLIRALMIKNPVMFVVEIVAAAHHRDLHPRPADGRRRTSRLHLPDHPLAVGDGAVRQLRRGGGGRPRQGAGGDAASSAHRDHGEAACCPVPTADSIRTACLSRSPRPTSSQGTSCWWRPAT